MLDNFFKGAHFIGKAIAIMLHILLKSVAFIKILRDKYHSLCIL
jgi:hypothetical protein